MFIGEYKHNVDEKNRISLPSKFRKKLGNLVVVTRGLDGCLFLFPHKDWEGIAEQISKGGWSAADRGFSRFMFSGAFEVSVDSMGRILIPETLMKFADLKASVVFTGLHNRIEIWNEKRNRENERKNIAEAEALAEKVGSVVG